MKRRIIRLTLLAAVLILAASGCETGDSARLSDNKDVNPNSKVLLSVTSKNKDGYDTVIEYKYNKDGQIIQEKNSFSFEGGTSVEIYDLNYDSEGRLIKKIRSSGDSGYSNDDLERKYDDSGNLIEESRFEGEYWAKVTYTYNSDNRVDHEVWKVDYYGDGSEFETQEYKHSYLERSDGTLEDTRQLKQDGEWIENCTLLFDSSGRLIQDYDDYWAVPVQYKYFEDDHYIVYTESKNIEDGGDMESTYAEIPDAAGKAVDMILLSSPQGFEYDSEGYLIKADDGSDCIELIYGSLDGTVTTNPETGKDKETSGSDKTDSIAEYIDDHFGSNLVYKTIRDYDGDGLEEAFVVTGEEAEYMDYQDATIYFVSNDLKTETLLEDTAGSYVNDDPESELEKNFFVWNQYFGGSGGNAYIFGCRDGSCYSPKLPDECIKFGMDQGRYYGVVSDWNSGYHKYMTHYYDFDSSKGEFIMTGEETLIE